MKATTATYIVTPMTADNLVQVVELEKSCGLSLWGHEGYAAELNRTDAVTLIVRKAHPPLTDGELNGESIEGFIAARLISDELHINNIAVQPNRRRSGIGGMLLNCALTKGKTLGAMWAVLEVRESNFAAKALYSHYGFDLLGRRRSYYVAPEEDALIMGKSL